MIRYRYSSRIGAEDVCINRISIKLPNKTPKSIAKTVVFIAMILILFAKV